MTTLLILTAESESIILSKISFNIASQRPLLPLQISNSGSYQMLRHLTTIASVLQYTWLLLHSFFLSFWSQIVTHSSSRRSTSSHLQVSFQSLHLFSSYPFPLLFLALSLSLGSSLFFLCSRLSLLFVFLNAITFCCFDLISHNGSSDLYARHEEQNRRANFMIHDEIITL